MALFKIEKGLAANLAINRPTAVEGYCYFTSDDGKFYIDIANGTALTPADNQGELKGVTRMPINAYLSDKAKTADWAARSLADINGNEIDSHYGNSLEITDTYNLKLFAHDANKTLLSTVTLPKNVDTASKFTSKQTIKLTGAVTGEHSSQAGWEISTTLADNIVTTAKINNAAVTNAKIANGAVSNGKIANSTISNEKLVNSSITIGGKTVSLGGSLTLAEIGLSSALRFIGQTTTAIVDGGTTSPVSVNGSNVIPTIGDVVINSNNNQEYVWLGSNWELLGDESSYALKDHTHKYAGSSSAGGAANSANKLNTNAGSTTQPVYFESGIPKACVDKFVFYESVGESSGIDTSTLFVEKKGDVMTGNLTAPKFIGALQGNADTATALTSNAGSATQPIYFENGKPKNTTYTLAKSVPSDAKFTDTVYTHPAGSGTNKTSGLYKFSTDGTSHISGVTAVTKADITALGIPAQDTVYTHPTTSGNKHIPSGGSSGQILRWSADGTAVWGNDNNTTYGSMSSSEGITGTATTSRVLTAANLKAIINGSAAAKLVTARTISLTGDVSGSTSFDGSGNVSITTTVADDSHNHTYLTSPGRHTEAASSTTASSPSEGLLYSKGLYMTENYNDANTPVNYGNIINIAGTGTSQIFCEWSGSDNTTGGMFYRSHRDTATGGWGGWRRIWLQGDSVTGAVWNDYAECRESDCEEFGYVLMEVGDDSLTKTTERLSHFAGVSSDTWGFSQGETDKAKTPIAVAGRVLVYPYQDRNNYKPGDCVCAAPGGTVDIMTREEVREWPDRIVGTVSCVPEYEEWGGGEGADRDPVKVNNRIWIKVK